MRLVRWLSVSLVLSACAGNPYGYARTYSPLGDEEDFLDRESLVTYEDVRRTPRNFGDTMVGWFGVVTEVSAPDANAPRTVRVTLSHRIHQERHLCGDERSVSCRVTVSDRSVGDFRAELSVSAESLQGEGDETTIRVGDLVKVYGTPDPSTAPGETPVLRTAHARHWPRGTYATTSDRERLRR